MRAAETPLSTIDAAPAERPAGPPRRTLGAVSAAHFVHDGLSDALYVLLPIWAQAFGLSYAQVGALKTAYSGTMALLQMPAGVLAERIGARWLLAAGTALAGAAFGALAWADGYLGLMAFIFLFAVGSATQHPLSSFLISAAFPATSRRSALGVYNFFGDVGKMCLAFGMGIATIYAGWRASVAGYGLVVIVLGVLLVLLLGYAGTRAPVAPEPGQDKRPESRGWGFTDRRGFLLLSVIHLIDSGSRTGFLTFLPFLMLAKGGTSASIGLGLALVFVGGAAGKLACGLLAERLGVIRTVIATEIATAALILATLVVPLVWVMILLPVVGVMLNGTSSVLYGTVAEFVRADRQARSFGLFYTLGSAAGAVSPLVFGIVSDLAGVSSALCVIAVAVLAAAPVAAALAPHVIERDRPL